MKDLADRIEEMSKSPERLPWVESLMGKNIPAITKALRFAEDMQTLGTVDVQIERGDQPGDQWLITIHPDGEEIQVQHLDIFEAASHAVAEIESRDWCPKEKG